MKTTTFLSDCFEVYRLDEMKAHWKATRMKLFAARTAIDVQPELVERTRFKMEAHRKDIVRSWLIERGIKDTCDMQNYKMEYQIMKSRNSSFSNDFTFHYAMIFFIYS